MVYHFFEVRPLMDLATLYIGPFLALFSDGRGSRDHSFRVIDLTFGI